MAQPIPDHEEISIKIQRTVEKLRFIYDIQNHERFWYANSTLLTESDVRIVNKEFSDLIGSRFMDLGLSIGSSFTKESQNEISVQLYKFDETLTRLFSNQAARTVSTENTSDYDEEVGDEMVGVLDSTLLMKTLIRLLMLKLQRIDELLRDHKVSRMEHKIIDDILVKNISHKVLVPFHSLILNRAQLQVKNLIS